MALEVTDFWMSTHTMTQVTKMGMESRSIIKPGAKLITIFSGDLAEKSNYQDLGRYAEVDLAIAADAEATLPYLIEACKKLITADRKRAFAARGVKYAEAAKRTREQALDQASY